jgi:hypothetical protein
MEKIIEKEKEVQNKSLVGGLKVISIHVIGVVWLPSTLPRPGVAIKILIFKHILSCVLFAPRHGGDKSGLDKDLELCLSVLSRYVYT